VSSLLRRRIPLWIVLIIIAASVAAAAAVIPKTLITVIKPAVEVVTDDPRIAIYNFNTTGETFVVALTAGDANPGSPQAPNDFGLSPYPTINCTAITAGNYIYRFIINETSATALGTSIPNITYRVDVYATYDAGTTYSLLCTAYVGQTAIPSLDVVEGVIIQVDVGTSLPDKLKITVSQIAGSLP
jgi:hypothetical protein